MVTCNPAGTGYTETMLKVNKVAATVALAAVVLLTNCDVPTGYVARLQALRGTPYLTLDCARYICAAKRHSHCGSAAIFSGCNGDMTLVKQVSTLAEAEALPVLQPGDVADFHGVHVAAYVGNGQWMDSNPDHSGVGTMDKQPNPHDLWYTGPVRILRWNK